MSPYKTLVTAKRVLTQLHHDRRTLALVLFIPCLLLVLLKYVFEGDAQLFNRIAPMMLGIFPLIMMFLVTSIATLRERTTGTLDRLMTQPISKLDLLFGYALAFSLLGLLQAALASIVSLGLLDVTVLGGTWPVIVLAVSAAFLGTSLGLLVSAFATSEFQAVQLVMPIMMPQVLLGGLFISRDHMAPLLEGVSNALPLTYAIDGMRLITTHTAWSAEISKDLAIILSCGIISLTLGAITIRRQE